MLLRSVSIALCVFSLSAWAGSAPGVARTVTGFVFDAQENAIRPMLGIPSAARLGAPAVSGMAAASISPAGPLAIGIEGGDLVLYRSLTGRTPETLPIAHALATASRFAWAPDGAAAAVYSPTSRQAQIVSQLDQTPAAGARIDLASLPGPVTALACDGQRVLAAVAGGGIYAATPAGIARIAVAANPSALALAGADLYFADSASQQIWQVVRYATAPTAVLFASASASVQSPSALQVSADHQRLYLADAQARTLTIYDVASRTLSQSIALPCTPTHLDRFGDASVFLLNANGPGPYFVLADRSVGQIGVYFVPAQAIAPSRRLRMHPVRRIAASGLTEDRVGQKAEMGRRKAGAFAAPRVLNRCGEHDRLLTRAAQ